jgi:hypothetical protein
MKNKNKRKNAKKEEEKGIHVENNVRKKKNVKKKLKEKRGEKSYMKGKGTISHAYRYINKMVRVLDQQHLFSVVARVSV